MFGTLTVQKPETDSLYTRGALRLRPAKGLRHGGGLYRMTMFTWAEVTLSDGWKDTLREKRGRSIPYALCANLASMYLGGLMIENLPLA